MAFDVEGARKAGYSDAEIVDHLATERKFDASSARKSGYTDAEILGHLREPLAPAGPDPNAPSRVGSMARGVVQGATFGFGDELRAGTDALAAGLTGGNMGETYDRSLAANREGLRRDMETNPAGAVVGQVAGGVGTALVGGAAAGAAGLTAAAGRVLAPVAARLNPLLAGAARVTAGGAAGGAATGFGEGEGGLARRLDAAGEGAVIGGAAGAATHGAFGAANRMLNPIRSNLSPEAAALRAAAQAEGIPLSVGQETGSGFMKNVDSQLAQLPGSAGLAADAMDAQKRAFNAAVLRRSGTGADIASPDVLNAARQRIGGVIEDVSNRNTLQVTPDLEARLAQIEDSLQFMPAEAAGPVRARLEQVRGMMQPDAANGGGMIVPGAAYRTMDSQLGRSMRGTTNGDLRTGLGDLREHLRTAMDGSISPADQAAWQQARREYANLMVSAKAAGGAGGATAEGHISPLALRQALDQSTGGGYVWGRGDLNELARVGQGVLRQPPDSGTAGRSLINGMLTGSAPVAGFAAGGIPGAVAGAAAPFVLPNLAQRFINGPGRNWLINGLGQLDPALAGAGAVAAGSFAERNKLLQD
jgi:hypothetical protein